MLTMLTMIAISSLVQLENGENIFDFKQVAA